MSKPQNIREMSKGKRDIWHIDPRVITMKAGWTLPTFFAAGSQEPAGLAHRA